MAPASRSAAHRIGAAWPFESTNTSASPPEGSPGSKRISSKNRTDITSAHDMQVVGWPEADSAVISSECRRSFWDILRRTASSTAIGLLPGVHGGGDRDSEGSLGAS